MFSQAFDDVLIRALTDAGYTLNFTAGIFQQVADTSDAMRTQLVRNTDWKVQQIEIVRTGMNLDDLHHLTELLACKLAFFFATTSTADQPHGLIIVVAVDVVRVRLLVHHQRVVAVGVFVTPQWSLHVVFANCAEFKTQ